MSTNFSDREMHCRCWRPECDAPPMRPGIVAKAQRLRDLYGKPLLVVSGARCSHWNTEVGGAPASQHLLGNAMDIRPENGADLGLLEILIDKLDFAGVGIYPTWIHIDDGPMGRRWRHG